MWNWVAGAIINYHKGRAADVPSPESSPTPLNTRDISPHCFPSQNQRAQQWQYHARPCSLLSMFTQCFSNNIYKGSQVPLKCSRQTSIPRKWISSEGWASVIFQLVKISNNLFQFNPSPGNMKSGTLLAQSSSPGVNGSRASKAARGQSFCNFIVDVYNKLSWRLDDLSTISFWVDTLIKLFVKNL